MKRPKYLSRAFWVRKVAGDALGLPPSAVAFLGAAAGVGGLDVLDLLIGDADRKRTNREAAFEHDPVTAVSELGQESNRDQDTRAPSDLYANAAGCDTAVDVIDEAELAVLGSMTVETAPMQDEQQLREGFKYGCFARCAYLDTQTQVDAYLSQCSNPGNPAASLRDSVHGLPVVLKYNRPLDGSTTGDTEVVVFRMADGELVFAFRGTAAAPVAGGVSADAAADGYGVQAPLSSMVGMRGRYPEEVKVHGGFLASFNDVLRGNARGQRLQDVALDIMGAELPTRVVCCGHSVGGALATLGTVWAAEADIFAEAEVHCYAFGSPRVGNLSFAALFEDVVPHCLRFTHKSDVVPVVPPMGWYKHVGQPVMLIEPADEDFGMLGGCDETGAAAAAAAQLAAGMTRGGYMALLGDRPMFCVYLGVYDHCMDAYLDALSQLLCCKPPPISELASSHDAKTFHSLIQAGAFGAAGRLGGSAGTPSLADMQQQLYAAAPAGDLPAAMRPRVPESCDMFNVLQQRSGRVRLMRQAAGHAVPRGWRMATCADVLTHMHKAWNAVSSSKASTARLYDGTLKVTRGLFSSKVAELRAVLPTADSSNDTTDVLLISAASALSPAVLHNVGGLVRRKIEAEGGVVRGVLCGEVFFLLSRSEQLYAGYRLATRAEVEGKAGIRNVQAVDNLLPADKFWVTLDNAWARRATLRNTTADRHLRVTDEMPDGAPWKLLVRDCDVDKAHKRLSDAGGAAAGDMESIAAVHALCEDNWQVLPAADDVPDGWRLASCWEVFSLMPYDCSGSQLLTHYWAKHFDINIALLDGHIKLPGDVGKGATCLFKLSCSQLPLKSCVYSLIIRAPATITPEQQQLMDAVHGILTSNQGSAVMAAAPAAAGADVRGWLALLRCNHAAAMPGYEVVSYHTARTVKERLRSFGDLLRQMLVKSHHTGSAHAKALLQGGHISLPLNITSKEYRLKRMVIKLDWKEEADVTLHQDNSPALTLLLRSRPRI